MNAYEASRDVKPVPFESIVGSTTYADYWRRMDRSIEYLRDCYDLAVKLKVTIAKAHGASERAALAHIDEAPIDDPPGEAV